jgi:hypothetical protein
LSTAEAYTLFNFEKNRIKTRSSGSLVGRSSVVADEDEEEEEEEEGGGGAEGMSS